MFIERNAYSLLKKELKKKQITAIVGSRQVGKTTLIKKLQEETEGSRLITFEDLKILRLFEENIELFIEQYIKPYKTVFIDEFQYAQQGGKNLKLIYDTQDTKIFISGSSQPEIAINSLQHLVGRVNFVEIYPLTFDEFINFKDKEKLVLFEKTRNKQDFEQINELFEQYLQYGGYPEAVKSEDKEDTLKNLVNTYLLKEIKDVLGYRKVYEFENLMLRLALQDGKLLNKSSISNETGVNRNKIDEIINVLSKTYISDIIRPYLKNKIKEQRKSPKVYFEDTGFKNALINNFNRLALKEDKGEIYENFVRAHLARNKQKIRFWNLKNAYEIDFVVENKGRIIGFEIKSKLKTPAITKSTRKFIDEIKPDKVYILNEDLNTETAYKGTKVTFSHILNIINIIRDMK